MLQTYDTMNVPTMSARNDASLKNARPGGDRGCRPSASLR